MGFKYFLSEDSASINLCKGETLNKSMHNCVIKIINTLTKDIIDLCFFVVRQ